MSRSKNPLEDRRGFLLLEVLVSVAIISMGLIYVVRSFSSSTRAIETAGAFLKSVSLAEEKLWDLEAKGVIKKGKDEGLFEYEQGYRWRVEAEELEDAPVNSVNLKIEWKGLQRTQRVSFTTYLWNEEE